MRVPIIGGPHDGAYAIISNHAAEGSRAQVGKTLYTVRRPFGQGPHLGYAEPVADHTDGGL